MPFGGVGDGNWGAYPRRAGIPALLPPKSVLGASRAGPLNRCFIRPIAPSSDQVMGLLRCWFVALCVVARALFGRLPVRRRAGLVGRLGDQLHHRIAQLAGGDRLT